MCYSRIPTTNQPSYTESPQSYKHVVLYGFSLWQVVVLFINGKWPSEEKWIYPVTQLKNRGVEVYVVTTDPSADKPDAVRAASGERFIFRTNPDSDIEDAHPKIAYAITKGWY